MRGKYSTQAGFTLVEVMLALLIMAMIAITSGAAFNSAATGSSSARAAMDRLAQIDRAFVLIENDLRNALAVQRRSENGQGSPLMPLYISMSEDYWMTVLRGGVANPLFQRRTEEVRVGYRYIDETLWRDTWYNPSTTDEDEARKRKLLTGIENLNVEVLSRSATSISGSWGLNWPLTGAEGGTPTMLPMAIRLKVELDDMGEITRVFSLLPGNEQKVR